MMVKYYERKNMTSDKLMNKGLFFLSQSIAHGMESQKGFHLVW